MSVIFDNNLVKQFFLLSVLILVFCWPKHLSAHSNTNSSNQFITIVNPVRVSTNNPDTLASIERQYQILSSRKLPATWLFTYDVLLLPNINNFSAVNNSSYDLGLWLEITPSLARDAGVTFVSSDSWHRAKSVFLSGYLQPNRLKLIDTLFNKYYQLFGTYPTSVGAWWVDSYSLNYIQAKYHVTANLGVADQHSTDGYHVWGQYWAAPFYPSKFNTALPASSLDQKIDLVNLQWAPRDPIHGYGLDKASLFSSQDYYAIGKDEDYLGKLINTYGQQGSNSFGQFTIGLEGDMPAEGYLGQYSKMLSTVQALSTKFQITNMRQFSQWYSQNNPGISEPYFTITRDLLGGDQSAIWFQSPNYRINFLYNQNDKTITVRDFRVFPTSFYEPYYQTPNTELDLYINTPSVIDSASNPQEAWQLSNIDLTSTIEDHTLTLSLGQNRSITLAPDKLELKNITIPDLLKKSPLLTISNNPTVVTPLKTWEHPKTGLTIMDLSIEDTFFLKTKKIQGLLIAYILLSTIFIFFIRQKNILTSVKIFITLIPLVIGFSFYQYWTSSRLVSYSVSNDEIAALQKLSSLPTGKVVVYDKFCLQCHWSTEYKPAVYANKRDYVSRLSGKPIIYSKSVFDSLTRPEAKAALKKLNAKYIYTVKYDNYLETPPFSPGDLGITKIFENASAQIWQIKD